MKERGEPHVPVLPRHLAHTIQITRHAQSGTASGTCFTGRVPLGQAAFPPPPPPPAPRARSAASQVVRGLSDCSWSCVKGLPPQRCPHGPPSADLPPREPSRTGHHQPLAGDHELSRFSRMELVVRA